MTRKTLQTILVVGMVLLAGCAGGLSGSPTTALGEEADGVDGGAGGTDGGAGTVAFYISDQPNAIEDFEHLNVTISQVGLQQAGGDVADETETEADDPETETEEDDSETETEEDEPEASEDDESSGWLEQDVDNRTVDLTELLGDNATMLAEFDLPNGTYNKVFVHVSQVEATLETGETVNVKLPSEKLQLNKQFKVGNGESVDFVFDIAVHKAGNSGKYILRPVIGESGTDVPIERVDDDDEGDDRDVETGINASFLGEVAPGENATVSVANASGAVVNATVTVNGDRVGTTDADGTVTFAVPDGEELEVEIQHDDAEAELEREFEDKDEAADSTRAPTATPAS